MHDMLSNATVQCVTGVDQHVHITREQKYIQSIYTGKYRWFSWGMASLPEGESGCAVGAAVRQRSATIESLPPVPKNKKTLFLSRSAVQLPLHHAFALRK